GLRPYSDLDKDPLAATSVLTLDLLEHRVREPDFERALNRGLVEFVVHIQVQRLGNWLANPILRLAILPPGAARVDRLLCRAQIGDGEVSHRIGPFPRCHHADQILGAVPHRVAERDGHELAPFRFFWGRCEVYFAAVDAEVGAVPVDARLLAFLLGHGVEHADHPAAIDQRAASARVLDGIAVVTGAPLAHMVLELDGTVLPLSNCRPYRFNDRRHLVVIVLSEAGAVDERIDGEEVDCVPVNGALDLVDHLLVEFNSGPAFVRDDEVFLATAVGEQPVAEVFLRDAVVFEDRSKAAVDLFLRVFQVDVPDTIGALRFDAE